MSKLRFVSLFACALFSAQASTVLVNGDFETGNLTPWIPFTTTSNGTNGSGLPNIVSFDTTGSGATLASHFNVGQSVFVSGSQEGGGLTQTFTAADGMYDFFANVASQNASASNNRAAGLFSILIDNATIATTDLGMIGSAQTLRSTISGSMTLSAGAHMFEILITRPFGSGIPRTPDQYVDNVSLSPTSTPEPSTAGLTVVAVASLIFFERRRRRLN